MTLRQHAAFLAALVARDRITLKRADELATRFILRAFARALEETR